MLMLSSFLTREIDVVVDTLTRWFAIELPHMIGGVIVLLVGWWLAGRVHKAIGRLLNNRIDPILCGVISSLVHYAILILVTVAALTEIGVEMTSVLAALGAAGLAIGLAIQGTLSNIAAGLMLIWLRPFRVGDYVETGSFAGTVKELGLFATEIHSYDGIFQFVPNSELWNKRIVNYTRLERRMIDLKFGISYSDDIAAGKQALVACALADERVLQDPAPLIFVDELADSAVILRIRVWSATADYWPLRRALLESGKLALEAAGLSIPFPQRDLHLRNRADKLMDALVA